MADFEPGDADLEAFLRARARSWLEENFPHFPARRSRRHSRCADARRRARSPATPPSGASGWARRAGAPRPGPRPTAAAGLALRRPGSWPRRWRPSARAIPSSAWAPACSARPCSNTARKIRSSATSRPSCAASCAGARAIRSPAPDRTWPRCRPGARTPATTGRSTARRSGPPAPSTPTGASAWSAPTLRRSTRASPLS